MKTIQPITSNHNLHFDGGNKDTFVINQQSIN